MGVFQRLFKIGEAKANVAVDALENPVEMTQQAIRDLQKKLQSGLEAEAQLKALVIGMKTDAQKGRDEAAVWEQRANALLDKAEKGEITQEDSDRLAAEALSKQKGLLDLATRKQAQADAQEQSLQGVDNKIRDLKNMITETQDHLTELTARAKTAEASKAINKELTSIGLDNTKALIQRMEAKVSKDENLAEAYGSLEDHNNDTETEIKKILSTSSPTSSNDALQALKAQRALAGHKQNPQLQAPSNQTEEI
jgi:phage shock protein A